DRGAPHAQHGGGDLPLGPRHHPEPPARARAPGARRAAAASARGRGRAGHGRVRAARGRSLESAEEAPVSDRRAALVAVVGLVVAWEIVGRLDVSMFVPPLSRVAAAWWHLALDGALAR